MCGIFTAMFSVGEANFFVAPPRTCLLCCSLRLSQQRSPVLVLRHVDGNCLGVLLQPGFRGTFQDKSGVMGGSQNYGPLLVISSTTAPDV